MQVVQICVTDAFAHPSARMIIDAHVDELVRMPGISWRIHGSPIVAIPMKHPDGRCCSLCEFFEDSTKCSEHGKYAVLDGVHRIAALQPEKVFVCLLPPDTPSAVIDGIARRTD